MHHAKPSEGGTLPAERLDEPLNLPEYLSLSLSSLDRRLTAQCLKRKGGALESRYTKGPRTERGTLPEVNMGDYGIFHSNEGHLLSALVPEDHQNAIRLPTAGWPSY